MKFRRCHAGVWILALGLACSTNRPYVTQRVHLDADASEAFEAIVAFATTRGWTVVDAANDHHSIKLLTPSYALAGIQVRDRWLFRIEGDVLEARKTFEADFGDGHWVSEDEVCDDYQYAAERRVLMAIHDASAGEDGGSTTVSSSHGDFERQAASPNPRRLKIAEPPQAPIDRSARRAPERDSKQ